MQFTHVGGLELSLARRSKDEVRNIFLLSLWLAIMGCRTLENSDSYVPNEIKVQLEKPITMAYAEEDAISQNSMQCTFAHFPLQTGVSIGWDKNYDASDSWGDLVIVGTRSLEARYFLSWLLHFTNTKARIDRLESGDAASLRRHGAKGKYKIAFDGKDRPQESYFNCFQDRSGKWRERIDDRLRERYTSEVTELELRKFLTELIKQRSFSFIFDPKASDIKLSTRVAIPTKLTTVGETLTEVLRQLGLAYRLQGGVVYVFRTGPGSSSKGDGKSDQ